MIITLLLLINAVRAHPLVEDPILDQRAQIRAEQLCASHQWSHLNWQDSFKGTPYRVGGENLATGFKSEEATFVAWMNSAPHRANIVKNNYTNIGVGHACGIEVNLFGGFVPNVKK